MILDKHSDILLKAILSLQNKHGYQAYQFFRWMIDDALADLGIKKTEIPPEKVWPELYNLGQKYAEAVMHNEPLTDILGNIYMELAGKYQQKHLGQYFTPWPIALMMSKILQPDTSKIDTDKLFTVYDPACGSGIMLLAFAHNVIEEHGTKSLRYFSFNGIDLDHLCAKITTCQFLSNALIHQCNYGELLVYHGNALDDFDKLDVVVHATHVDLPDSQFIPAKAQCRAPAIREATNTASKTSQASFDF